MWPNWGEVFRLDVNPLELMVRTSIVYLVLVIALRLVARREVGAFELPELLMIVLIADGVQNGLAGDYHSLPGALIVAGTLIGCNYALDWLEYHSRLAHKLLRPPALKLAEDGRLLRRNMRRELITERELRDHLRLQGIEDLSEVKLVYLEANGEMSVIKREKDEDESQPRRRSPFT